MNDAHADEMQVQTWKPNTWGVTPHIKYFYLKVVVQGHCIASVDASMELALSTPSYELLGVSVHH
jgi:hypothetical protein